MEVNYVFVKGKGWVAKPAPQVLYQGIKTRDGEKYKVTLIGYEEEDFPVPCRVSSYKWTKYPIEHVFNDLLWWPDFAGVPAGFGGATESAYLWEYAVVLTEKI